MFNAILLLDDVQYVYLFLFQLEDVLPRPNYVSAILKNVGALYYGCQFQPRSRTDSDPEGKAANFFHFDNEKRPTTGTPKAQKLSFCIEKVCNNNFIIFYHND